MKNTIDKNEVKILKVARDYKNLMEDMQEVIEIVLDQAKSTHVTYRDLGQMVSILRWAKDQTLERVDNLDASIEIREFRQTGAISSDKAVVV